MGYTMKLLIQIEEATFFVFSIVLFLRLPFGWWWFPLLLFIPDIGMVGYLINTKIGAVVYNIVHHRSISILLYTAGFLTGNSTLQLIGIILFAHSSLDRVFDYGLKYGDRFKHTHLSSG